MKKKRTQLDIIHDMLESVQKKGGRIKPTHLLAKSNLSYKMMQEYLATLESRGLIATEATEEHKEYVLTDKGLAFLFEYKRMATFTEAFGL